MWIVILKFWNPYGQLLLNVYIYYYIWLSHKYLFFTIQHWGKKKKKGASSHSSWDTVFSTLSLSKIQLNRSNRQRFHFHICKCEVHNRHCRMASVCWRELHADPLLLKVFRVVWQEGQRGNLKLSTEAWSKPLYQGLHCITIEWKDENIIWHDCQQSWKAPDESTGMSYWAPRPPGEQSASD